jgi:hypothetical protein
MQEFQLRVVPTDNNNFALELYQCAYKKAGEKKRPAAKRVGRLKGQALVQARQAVYECLKTNGYDPKTLSYSRQTPYVLSEESGVIWRCYSRRCSRSRSPIALLILHQG